MRLAAGLIALALLAPVAASAQSASEVERCFQNPAACSNGGAGGAAGRGTPAPTPPPAPVAARPAPAPDYTTVLNSPDPERRKIQESLRTLDKYNGPIDGNLQSEATMKAIADWQKGRNTPAVGKLTPQEAAQLNAEAARAPIRRLESPPPQTAAPVPLAPPVQPSNADALKALQAKLAERRKAAEPKANAAAQALVRDLKAYVAADGKGVAGDQFTAFAKWYADNKAVGRTVAEITPVIDDYGDAKAGAATTTEVKFETKQGDKTYGQCLVFGWIEATPRKNPQAFTCDDVAAVEKWKTDQALKSAWR
ncbi:peptidoglycan-binding domain-containing protein [Reyranella sp.]|uniref:peptidoglycan-binding domain-containing protein n=1 Tax=Reyranella sp. TaxID=1929291 RepID=UPI00271735E2|nr:peptidoglycan-binding domain-containing protein [Reyranella sp.]MDO8973562.1 peptidoglycan-binding domain-containing protein [Reyranella sp.]